MKSTTTQVTPIITRAIQPFQALGSFETRTANAKKNPPIMAYKIANWRFVPNADSIKKAAKTDTLPDIPASVKKIFHILDGSSNNAIKLPKHTEIEIE